MNRDSSHEQMIQWIIQSHFGQMPTFVHRIPIGICNEVYRVGLAHESVIARLSFHDRFLLGSHDHIPKFKALGIRVPDILAEDYSKQEIPLSYQILSKIEGQDLGQVIATLSEQQLRLLAKEIAAIFQKVSTIPASEKFGILWGGGEDELSDTWTERMWIWIEESKERGRHTGVMDRDMNTIADNLYARYQDYFATVQPITYYGDICSKNVMIHHGQFTGLVDLDGLTQGDPLEAVGRINLSWYGTRHGEIYAGAIMDALHLDQAQKEIVTMYSLLNQISWACENGIQLNQNTTTKIDPEKKSKDQSIAKKIATELNMI